MTIGIVPATGLQNGSWACTGNQDTIIAPCQSEKFTLRNVQHAFTVTFADVNGNPIGVAAAARVVSSSCWEFDIISGRSTPFTQGQTICFVTGTSADTLYICPDRSPA